MSNKIERVLKVMEHLGVIPNTSNFDISEKQINSYIDLYAEIHGKGNAKYDRRFARKLAGLNLLKYKLSLGATYKSCKEGLLYVIENPAFPDFYKVGMTVDLDKRLQTYQTYDPNRLYKVKTYEFVLDRKAAESKVLNSTAVDLHNGEWIKKTEIVQLIKYVD